VPCPAIINHAAEGELCQHIKVKRFKVEKKIKSPFTIEWVDVFCRHATPHLSALTLFMFATGARISEALAVEWDHVDLRRCTALIPKSKISEQRQAQMREQAGMMVEMLQQNTALTERVETLLKQNTELTETIRTLVERIDAVTTEVHTCVAPSARS